MRHLLLALLFFSVACSNSSEPPPPFTVTFSDVTRSTGLNPDTQRHECRFDLTATASGGRTQDFALWLASQGEFRLNDGTEFEFDLDVVDVLDYWGSDRIVTGETQVAPRAADASEPFDLAYTFRYQDPDGRFLSEFVFVDCQ